MLINPVRDMSILAPTPLPTIRSICVYCGSGFGSDPVFAESAAILGRGLARSGISLVYGGGNVGLMGTVARSVLDHGGVVTGIIPDFLKSREKMLDDVQETIVVPDMHTRKRLMFERADAFVALPGGIGTLEELVEQMTWAQLGQHRKPILLLSTNGFWKPLLVLLAHMREQGFIRPGLELNYLVAERVEDVIPMLEASARRVGLESDDTLIEKRF
ncbi:TIGR00730 family Rossman fold protein [Microvirga massiliensis]|uniref:LOG family protein n=1 Tax=Microvirga massiliensis TaxID=1033741 RepID=UPI000AE3C0BD|nr:TIGR00730 family Rossman fold protein [Microvirga massiliensis]